MNPATTRTIAWLCALACLATVLWIAYYALAQAVAVPGAEALRSRWNTATSYRGTSGHRMNQPRPAGPIETGRLVMVAIAFGIGAVSLRRRAGMRPHPGNQ